MCKKTKKSTTIKKNISHPHQKMPSNKLQPLNKIDKKKHKLKTKHSNENI